LTTRRWEILHIMIRDLPKLVRLEGPCFPDGFVCGLSTSTLSHQPFSQAFAKLAKQWQSAHPPPRLEALDLRPSASMRLCRLRVVPEALLRDPEGDVEVLDMNVPAASCEIGNEVKRRSKPSLCAMPPFHFHTDTRSPSLLSSSKPSRGRLRVHTNTKKRTWNPTQRWLRGSHP